MSEAPGRTCDLCGLQVPKDGLHLKAGKKDLAFCCEGCRGIWQMLNPGAAQAPDGGNIASAPRLVPALASDCGGGEVGEVDVAVDGMTCASCAALIQTSLNRDPLVRSASVNHGTGTATVVGRLDRPKLEARIKALGYQARPLAPPSSMSVVTDSLGPQKDK
jgi:copper chaperone CopZ